MNRGVVVAAVVTALAAPGAASIGGLGPGAVAAGTRSAAPAGSGQFSDGGVTAVVNAGSAYLKNSRIERAWTITGSAVSTKALLRDDMIPAGGGGPDFRIDINGVTTTSAAGWSLESVTPGHPAALPGRPTSSTGASLEFRYALVTPQLPAGIELIRTVTLHPGQAVLETTSRLVSQGAAARVTSYSLDQIAANPELPAEVQTFHGGSDWRDDYRVTSHPKGAFDAEGEVVRFGGAQGIFLVSQRRSGIASRVGRDANGVAWTGADWARDAFDYGPLKTDGPDYNRLDNPAYPVPVRSRVLPATGSLDLGTSYLGVYAGGAANAAAEFTRDFVGADEPNFPRTVGLNSFHPWNHGPGMSDTNLRKQVRIAKRLGVESFMLDDQWQGGAGGESGDWNWDPQRFPDRNHDGVPDFVTYLHRQGLALGLWMSPVEFNQVSKTYAAHPDWACAPTGDATAQVQDDAGLGVWDATNPQFQSYLLGVINRLVRVDDVREFKFDFMAWVDCGTHDYTDYEAAFVDLVHRMQAAHPGVTFELDETNDQRSWPFESAQIGPTWFDNGHLHGKDTAVAKLLHDVYAASPWVPAATIGDGLYDGTLTGTYAGVRGVDFLMPLALLGHVTFWSDLSRLSPQQRTETAWWIRWYRAHRGSFGSSTYELTSHDPLNGRGATAFQQGDGRRAYVFGFRQAGGSAMTLVRLHGLTPGATYRVVDARSGAVVGSYDGRALMSRGLALRLATHSARVLEVAAAKL